MERQTAHIRKKDKKHSPSQAGDSASTSRAQDKARKAAYNNDKLPTRCMHQPAVL